MRGLGGQPGPGARGDSRCVPDRQLRRSSSFDVAVAWDSNPNAGSFRVTRGRHAASLSERLLATKRDGVALNCEFVAVRVMENYGPPWTDRKSTRLNSSHEWISYAV